MKTTTAIIDSFSAASKTYARHSDVQEKAALQLAVQLQKIKNSIPQGPVLEIGCGTGIFTKQLASILPARDFIITDISSSMVSVCQTNVEVNARFATKDAEQIDEENKYALIVCAFAAQWFKDLAATFDKLLKALVPGGYLVFSVPTDESFPEWKEVCRELNVGISANTMPEASAIESYCKSRNISFDKQLSIISAGYPSSMDFFKALKGLGAALRIKDSHNVITSGSTSLLPIIRHWDSKSSGSVFVTYEVLFGVMQK